MTTLIIIIFILGYAAIAFESKLRINKAASALITGVLCWTVYIFSADSRDIINESLLTHLGDIASILFFLLGAMVIVELIGAHDGFSIITNRISTNKKGKLLIIISVITFFLSAVLDNLTTSIVMISLIRQILSEKEDRWYFGGMIIIAANAGGAWSPLGDVTTTMLWIGGQISASNIMLKLILPSLICCFVPTFVLWLKFKNQTFEMPSDVRVSEIPVKEQNLVFFIGIIGLLFVPVFKTLTHLPPFMGMMLALAVIWAVISIIHRSKDKEFRKNYSVDTALQKADSPSILFFLGILLAVAALQSVGILKDLSEFLTVHLKTDTAIGVVLGLISAVIDNVPLVAAAIGMYDLQTYPMDHFFWELIAFTTGTGGSAIIIGSAAGVAVMGIEKISFFWYLKKISWLALLGFFAGTATYVLMEMII
jgi:Na+/H+ antiporter NhaD/arsenite permease-like protein